MRPIRTAFLVALSALMCVASETGQLRYRAKLRFRGDAAPAEARFTVSLGEVAETANRTKKARLAPWRLEARQTEGGVPMALVLARVERLLYLAGPAPQTELQSLVLRYGERACPVWSVRIPKGLTAYAYLVELQPGLLALSYFSGSFPAGDLQSAEVQLEGFLLGKDACPAAAGQNLLTTLQRMATEAEASGEEAALRVD